MTLPPAVVTPTGRVVVVREPEHVPRGDPCALCSLPASRHRARKGRGPRQRESRRLRDLARPIVGIDGEGVDVPCARCGGDDRDALVCPDPEAGGARCRRGHVYTYLSAVDEDGRKLGSVARASGLSTAEILAFFCDLAEAGHDRLFGYSLGYDLTMWIGDMPDDRIYRIMRPETRNRTLPNGRTVRRGERWGGFEVDYLRRRIDVRRAAYNFQTGRVDRGPRATIWDVFGFYQGPFVRSLDDWKTAPADRIEQIAEMKRERAKFAHLPARQVQAYCDDECRLLARLVRQLIEAHEQAQLPLKVYYGAGSTASALLDRMGTKEYRGPDLPDALQHAVRCAFFGGRFELSRVGPVAGPVWNYDISSAYPYQATLLPCLACGAWRRYAGREADRRAREGRLAVVRCRVRRSGPASWGPLPWRRADGAILWPLRVDETWCWRDEYVAAKDGAWPGVEALETWVYDCSCAHAPFGLLPEVYRERCRIGKEGPGIVLKLGPNGVAGKTAQSVGSAPYRSWVWAGCITSGCRAQIVRAIGGAADPASVVMVATDGILSAAELDLPRPADTGTWDCLNSKGLPAPLGGWERKDLPTGVFVARPGIYWPLGEGEVVAVKSRGISRSVLGGMTCPEHRAHVQQSPGECRRCGRALERQSALIERHFAEKGWRYPYTIEGGVRFVGATAGVRRSGKTLTRDEDYGCWIPYPIEVTFNPDPKRAAVNRDLTLDPWERMAGPSAPYEHGRRCPEGEAMKRQEMMLREQPEGEQEFD